MIENFENIQPIAFRIVKNVVKQKKFSHAYIIETNGYNHSLDFAFFMAKEFICANLHFTKEEDRKNLYQKIDSFNYLDLKYVEPDGQWIKKEQLEELQKEFNKKPLLNNKKIYIINHADRLNISASNSILKFLEEPEEGIIAILIVDSIYQLLETILSRCQIIRLVNKKEILKKSEMETLFEIFDKKNFPQQENDNKNFLDQIEKILYFVKKLENEKKNILLDTYKLWHDTFHDKESISFAFTVLLLYYKDVLNFKCGRNLEVFKEQDSLEEISKKNTLSQVVEKIKILLKLKKSLDINANSNLLIDRLILEFEEV